MSKSKSGIGRRKYLKIAGGIGVAGLAGCVSQDGGDGGEGSGGSTRWVVGTVGEGSTTHAIANAFSRILDENNSSVILSPQGTSGTAEAIRLVGRAENEVTTAAFIQASSAYNNLEPVPGGPIDFTGDQAVEKKALQGLMSNDFRFMWITHADSGIESVSDLAGNTVSVGPTGGDFNFRTFLSELDLIEDLEPRNEEYNAIPGALDEGRVDASGFYATSGRVAPGWASEMVARDDIRVLPYNEDQLQILNDSAYTGLGTVYLDEVFETSSAFEYVGASEMTSTLMPYGFFFREDLNPNLVYEVHEIIMDNYEQAQEYTSTLQFFSPEFSAENLQSNFPVHTGAADFYKDRGLWRDDLTAQDSYEG